MCHEGHCSKHARRLLEQAPGGEGRARTLEQTRQSGEGTEKGDKLDVLLALVEIYEAKRWPIEIDESFDPIDVLNYVIEELGHTQAELAELLDSRSRASEVLSRRRALTIDMIHKISETWKIPADLLVRPYRIECAA
jgi:HTH-type transcriptional regulator/antitoxin HigA